MRGLAGFNARFTKLRVNVEILIEKEVPKNCNAALREDVNQLVKAIRG